MKKIIFALALLCSPVFMFADADVPAGKIQTAKRENWQQLFGNDLFDADGKKVSVSKATGKKYIGIYSSASWCGPCRAFTPQLIKFYQKNKSKIDIILLGCHYTKKDVCDYMKKYDMPWAGAFQTEAIKRFFDRHNVQGIPDFRVFTRSGELVIEDGYDLRTVQKLLDGKQ